MYVQEAKHQLSTTVGIDGFAGPSDLLVLLAADAGDREIRLAALDMLAQAEHGRGSLVAAVSPSLSVCEGLAGSLEALIVERPTVGEAVFAVLEAATAREALALANAFAPEHLQLMGADMEALAPMVRSAGCLFVGAESATAFGDYVAGSNHVLPTGGAARFASMLSTAPFPPPHGRGACRSCGAAARRRRRSHRQGRGLRRARGIDGGQSAGESPAMTRSATIERRTGETDVRLTLGLEGAGDGTRETGIGFLDHMLDLLARHGRMDLDVSVSGDLQTGAHHTAEDTAIVLGQALDAALEDRSGIVRYGWATVPMDEARASCAIDISGRPFTLFDAELPPGSTGGFEHELTEEFFRALANAAKITLHLRVEAGSNAHHMIEAAFKAFARALRLAVAIDPTETGVPSTKGTLTG